MKRVVNASYSSYTDTGYIAYKARRLSEDVQDMIDLTQNSNIEIDAADVQALQTAQEILRTIGIRYAEEEI